MAMFMNGAQGGMVTADNRNLDQPRDPQRGYWNDSRTWEECLRIGHLMADEALRIVKDAPVQKDPQLVLRLDRRAISGRIAADVGRHHRLAAEVSAQRRPVDQRRGSTSSTWAMPRS